MLCVCGLVFLIFALPFIVYDYFKREYKRKEDDRKRVRLNETLHRVSYR